jgi:predicted nucleic acid-binding Zn ribbon protein
MKKAEICSSVQCNTYIEVERKGQNAKWLSIFLYFFLISIHVCTREEMKHSLKIIIIMMTQEEESKLTSSQVSSSLKTIKPHLPPARFLRFGTKKNY